MREMEVSRLGKRALLPARGNRAAAAPAEIQPTNASCSSAGDTGLRSRWSSSSGGRQAGWPATREGNSGRNSGAKDKRPSFSATRIGGARSRTQRGGAPLSRLRVAAKLRLAAAGPVSADPQQTRRQRPK